MTPDEVEEYAVNFRQVPGRSELSSMTDFAGKSGEYLLGIHGVDRTKYQFIASDYSKEGNDTVVKLLYALKEVSVPIPTPVDAPVGAPVGVADPVEPLAEPAVAEPAADEHKSGDNY